MTETRPDQTKPRPCREIYNHEELGDRDDDSMSDRRTERGYVAPEAPQSQLSRADRADAALNSGRSLPFVATDNTRVASFEAAATSRSTDSYRFDAPESNGDASDDDVRRMVWCDKKSVSEPVCSPKNARFTGNTVSRVGVGALNPYSNGLFMPAAH
jgi:hypothetical protein